MDKVLTIIVPSYNMEKYLEKSLSFLVFDDKKIMDMFEVLVINDGSKDNTSEIGHAFERKYPGTFHTVDKENGHYGSCLNRGIAIAKGTFIKVMDADDSFDPDVFPDYLRFLSREVILENADAILSDYTQVDENLVLLSRHPYSVYTNPVTMNDLTKEDRERWFIHGLAYRTQYLRDIGHKQMEGIAYTDIEWCFYPLTKIRNLYRFDGYLYRYTKLREDQSVNPAVQGKNIGMQVKVIKKMIKEFPSLMGENLYEGNRTFLHDYINLQVSHIYQLFLLTLHHYIPSDEGLKDFDSYLLEHAPGLYKEVENYSTRVASLSFQPVKLYRQHKLFQIKFMQFLYSVADTKVRITQKIRTAN